MLPLLYPLACCAFVPHFYVLEPVPASLAPRRKMDSAPVSEDLRSCIRAYCTGLVAALNRYYAFGSVFVDDAQ